MCREQGFSLIEVTIALGIIGFCLTTLLGLLSVGASMSRSAMDRTVSAQIAQRLIGMAQQTDWSQRANLGSSYYYFDADGQPLEDGNKNQSVFSAAILVDDPLQVPPDGDGANDRLARLRIRIIRDPAHNLEGKLTADPLEASIKSNASEFAAFLADNGA